MNILSPLIGQGDRVYVTARWMDLITGVKKPPHLSCDVLKKEELRSRSNYLFYRRFSRLLTEAFPEVQFVRSADLYHGGNDRFRRWMVGKSKYSSLILITFPTSPYSTAQTILGHPGFEVDYQQYRYIDTWVAREVADLVFGGKPVCLVEVDNPPIIYRIIDRFALIPVVKPAKLCTAIVIEDQNASPYAPDCSEVEAALERLEA
jgi:hypothetical protein